MTSSIRTATRLVGLSALTLGGGLLLAGCAGAAPDIDQSVDVTYTNAAGETVDVSVDVPQIECSEVVGVNMFTADADDDRANGQDLLARTPGPDAEVGNLFSLALGDGLWFVSTNDFEGDEKSFTLDGLEGIVSPVEYNDGASDFGDAVDTAATASGTLECTTTD